MNSCMRHLPLMVLLGLTSLSSLVAQEKFSTYIGGAAAAKAARLVSDIEADSQAIIEVRQRCLAQLMEAQERVIQLYGLIAASKRSGQNWISYEGLQDSAGYRQEYRKERGKALIALKALMEDEGSQDNLSARLESSETLAGLIRNSGIRTKAALGLERLLLSTGRETRDFPETAQIEDMLRKEGAAGAREAASFAAFRGLAGAAQAILEDRQRIISLCPAASPLISRMEEMLKVHDACLKNAHIMAYPGEIMNAAWTDSEKAELLTLIQAFASMKPERAAGLMEAMETAGLSDQAAAEAVRRFATVWDASSAPGRRNFAAAYGIPEGIISAFASALADVPNPSPAFAKLDVYAGMAALSELASRLADAEARGAKNQGMEPSLLFLERPELAIAARSDQRYTQLLADCDRRLSSLYEAIDGQASSLLEDSDELASNIGKIPGLQPAAISVSAIDLGAAQGFHYGRRIAFVADIKDQTGNQYRLPITSDLAAKSYAKAFQKMGGLEAGSQTAQELLKHYHQLVCSVYDPSGEGSELLVDYYPDASALPRLSDQDLELALLQGWQP